MIVIADPSRNRRWKSSRSSIRATVYRAVRPTTWARVSFSNHSEL